MKIGIIVYSQTGNTYSIAEKLRDKLLAIGHSVNIERITPVDSKQMDLKKIQIERVPDIAAYEALIFCSPVQAFSLAPVMTAYMTQISSLANKKIACFVTEFFPFAWLGGNNAIIKMKKTCESKGGTVSRTGVVNWSNKQRERQIADIVENFSTLI